MRVVDAIARWFEVAGFKHYFGYAGGAVWPFLDALTDKPELINEDPYGQGWMMRLKPAKGGDLDGLLDAAAYTAFLASEAS